MKLKLRQIRLLIDKLEELKLNRKSKDKIVIQMKFKYKKIRKGIEKSGGV